MSSSIESTFESLPNRSDANGPPRQNPSPPVDPEKTVIRQGELLDVQDVPSSVRIPNLPMGLRHSTDQLIGQQLDHFLIESLVGTGGMGAVFRGRDLRLERIVAIKVVPIADRGAEAMRRFRVEAQSAAKLDHPNIARVYYVGETDRWSYIVFEYVEGTNLRELVFKQGLLSIDDAVCLTRQIAEALQHANQRCVVHRDIKPSNILITSSGQAKLVDMGLARTTELDKSTNDLTASGVTLGTFDYISPEQAHDPRDADVRSDIYSLGCTLYFLLTGQPPFPDGTALQKLLMHGTKMPEDPRFFRSDVSDSMIAILRKMMAKKPSDRYQEPSDLISDLQTLAQLEGLTWTKATENVASIPDALQRTWLEATLPLVFSLLFILGATLWLHNVSYRSSTFPIPREEAIDGPEGSPEIELSGVAQASLPGSKIAVADPLSPSSTATTSTAPNPENPITKPLLSETSGRDTIWVDPDLTPEREKANSVVRTMEQAFELVASQSQFKKIVIKGASVSTSLNSSKAAILLPPNLVIQGEAGKRSKWIIDSPESSPEASLPSSWLECSSGPLTIENVDIVWKPIATSKRKALLTMRSGTWLQLRDCNLSVHTELPASLSSAFDSGSNNTTVLPAFLLIDSSIQDIASDATSVSGSGLTRHSARVNAQRLSVRGQCDWIRYVGPVRAEVQVDNGWVAISGSMFDINGVRTAIRSSVPIRIDLRNVSSYTQRAWMRCNLSTLQPNPVPFVRTARECVFAGCKSLIEWNASDCQDWKIWEQTDRGRELTKWIDLRGTDNVYDSSSINNLLLAKLNTGKSEQVELSSDADLVTEERGLETLATWKKRPIVESARLHDANFSILEWNPGSYQPGFQPDK